ncbi:cell cycle arrest protein BUB2 [Acrasis kona]|uniref:Cell cycle arrest protein BUB2 n=1 Tax=Acrasis kona TaxID=1008807 RepID=A0AAW2YP72_9EUKA
MENVRQKFEDLLGQVKDSNQNSINQSLEQLRLIVMLDGIPEETEEERRGLIDTSNTYRKKGLERISDSDRRKLREATTNRTLLCSLRGRLWKIFLRIKVVDVNYYFNLVEKGPSEKAEAEAINNDVFRTFSSDHEFKLRVPDSKLLRMLNAFIHSYSGIAFQQGMSLLAAPFLFCLSEADAFYCYKRFVTRICSAYYTHEMTGCYAGVELVMELLEMLDPELSEHIPQRINRVWAFKYVSSFSTNQKPLSEALKLWDFFFAFGFHFNIVCIVAQAIMIREQLLKEKENECLLRLQKMDECIDARMIINVAIHLLRDIPEDFYKQLSQHTHNLDVVKHIRNKKSSQKASLPVQTSPSNNHPQTKQNNKQGSNS